jgi:hypothetical protein
VQAEHFAGCGTAMMPPIPMVVAVPTSAAQPHHPAAASGHRAAQPPVSEARIPVAATVQQPNLLGAQSAGARSHQAMRALPVARGLPLSRPTMPMDMRLPPRPQHGGVRTAAAGATSQPAYYSVSCMVTVLANSLVFCSKTSFSCLHSNAIMLLCPVCP